MSKTTRFDSGATPGVKVIVDDDEETVTIATHDNTGRVTLAHEISSDDAARAVELHSESAGVLALDPDNGLLWAIGPYGESAFSIQKDANTAQRIELTPASTALVVGILQAHLLD